MPPSSPVTATVTAVVPHWNRRDLLVTLLDNLSLQQRPFDEIIVVDNGSTDGSADLARMRGARVIQLDRNLGFAAAVNRGIEAAQSEWIAILNNDVTLAPDWLAVLLAAAYHQDSWEQISFATGKILSASNLSVLDGAFDEVSRGACAARCGSGKSDAPVWNQPRQIQFAPMTAALFRSELFRRLGGLDEIFGSYMEDVEFGMRCALAGCRGAYVPAAVACHQGSATLGRWSANSVRRISRNQVLLAAKHFTGQPRLPIILGQTLWGLVALRHGCAWAFLRGKFAGWMDRRQCGPRHASVETRKSVSLILEASETAIFELGQQTGLDRYWRAYFWLLRR
jgi:GT2 family glycosyltransferase